MPTYDYICEKCQHRFEHFQKMSSEPLKKCIRCEGGVKRIVSGGTGLIFKGSGFYLTDYKNKSDKEKKSKNKTKKNNEKNNNSKKNKTKIKNSKQKD